MIHHYVSLQLKLNICKLADMRYLETFLQFTEHARRLLLPLLPLHRRSILDKASENAVEALIGIHDFLRNSINVKFDLRL